MPSTDIAVRAQVVALKAYGVKAAEIEERTGIKPRTQRDIYARAIKCGFDPSQPVLTKYVVDEAKSGRPPKITPEKRQEVLDAVGKDRYGREKTCDVIADEVGLSGMSVWRVLRRAGLKKTKPTRKPGLTKQMRAERLAWCRAHEHWTLEDWKRVIWTDETAVVLNHRRGGYRIWRRSDERFVRSCIRERWKGYSEFMFWGCFSYDMKGPCHIWKPETAQEKKKADEHIQEMNEALEPILRAEWELQNGMRRLGLRNKPGKKPIWRFTKKRGKLIREKGDGIDWYCYQTQILIPKLIPFAQEYEKTRAGIIVQEDKAPCHAHHAQAAIYSMHKVKRMLWCGNSPDLNMIEPGWYHLKRVTSKKGAPGSRAVAEQVWEKAWNDLEQERIQAWIRRIQRHVKEVIRLEGGNEYREGEFDTDDENYKPRKRRGLKVYS
jgi:transposase